MAFKSQDKWGSHDYAKAHNVTGPPAIEMVQQAHQISPLDHPSARVLELGCGAGVLTAELARHFPDTPVLATDFSEGMVEKVRVQNLGNVETMQLDAMNLTPAEGKGRFTHILSTATIQFCGGPVKVVQEGCRLLSEAKGKSKNSDQKFVFGVGSWNQPDIELFYKAVYAELGIPSKFKPLFDPNHWPVTEEAIRQVLEEAGFKDIQTKQVVVVDGRSEEESMYWHWEYENPGLAELRKNAVEEFGVERCKEAAGKVYEKGRKGEGIYTKRPEDSTIGQLLALGCV